ncbi:UNVERIFIED_CONTAM: putative receptor-like protein kinase [Sesamum calycinum]|uniref:Receptor-like protein kinase n=1 Tax=Sesamum calycinum TaxID=2727403 RepID=A0AAW2QVG6_9LAMI
MGAKFLQFLVLSFCTFLFSTAFTPQDNYLINCGSNSPTVVVDNRHFVSDKGSAYLSEGKSFSLTNPKTSPGSPVLYSTARVFTSASSYAFSIKSVGTHLVRLHFSPFSSGNYDLKNGKFDVLANGISLLSNFGANSTVLKEFFLMVDKEELEILFTPASDSSLAYNVSSQILETVHRINVGGSMLTPFNDTLWRTWIPDEDFLYFKSAAKIARTTDPPNYQSGGATRETAPDNVYMTAQQMNIVNRSLNSLFNITWDFPVRPGDDMHFVRLHFCDIVSIALNTLYFNIYINGVTAYKDVDLSVLALHRLASPYYIDFIVKNVKGSGVVRVSVGPSDLSATLRKNAILNGVEIMRMVNFVASPRRSKKKSLWILVGSVIGGIFVLAFTFIAILAILKCRKRKPKQKTRRAESAGWTSLRVYGGSSQATASEGTALASPGPYGYFGLKIPFADIQLATNNFDKSLLIGSGGFGMVYKGVLGDNIKVAVKRGMPGSRQGLPEFHTEITVLSKIRHRHLVSLVGYCEEQSEMILVYEYMEKGPLRHHLYGTDLPPLSWKQRLEICIGAARGLHYLHTGSAQGIIHRDIKSTNILLDENYVAKVADFGLSKSGPCLNETHVLCARPAVDPLLTRDQVNLAEWAMEWQKKGMIEQIVDPHLKDQIKPSSLKIFGETAEKCLAEYGVDRPTMGDVLWNLEYVYQLQTNGRKREDHRPTDVTSDDPRTPMVVPSGRAGVEGNCDDGTSDISTSGVFSQLITNEGR